MTILGHILFYAGLSIFVLRMIDRGVEGWDVVGLMLIVAGFTLLGGIG